MICPDCETEYREGFTTCSDCGIALVEELEPPPLEPLALETSSDVVGALVEGLESEHIPYVVQAGTAMSLIDGDVDELTEPEPWHARIWIAPGRSEEAKAMLAEIKAIFKRQQKRDE